MSSNTPIDDIDGFCRLLAASGLITSDSIVAILDDFRAHVARDSKYGQSFTAFTTYLVANGVVTCWQYDKLRNGQYKGFFMDGYKLIDRIGDDRRCSRYLAESTSTGKTVVLCVIPTKLAPLKNGKFEYWIEEFKP